MKLTLKQLRKLIMSEAKRLSEADRLPRPNTGFVDDSMLRTNVAEARSLRKEAYIHNADIDNGPLYDAYADGWRSDYALATQGDNCDQSYTAMDWEESETKRRALSGANRGE